MKIYIIRHGETEWNKVCRLQGHSDVPLNENGIQVAMVDWGISESLESL